MDSGNLDDTKIKISRKVSDEPMTIFLRDLGRATPVALINVSLHSPNRCKILLEFIIFIFARLSVDLEP